MIDICETGIGSTNVDYLLTGHSETGVLVTNVDHDMSEECEVGVFWTNMDHNITKLSSEASVIKIIADKKG